MSFSSKKCHGHPKTITGVSHLGSSNRKNAWITTYINACFCSLPCTQYFKQSKPTKIIIFSREFSVIILNKNIASSKLIFLSSNSYKNLKIDPWYTRKQDFLPKIFYQTCSLDSRAWSHPSSMIDAEIIINDTVIVTISMIDLGSWAGSQILAPARSEWRESCLLMHTFFENIVLCHRCIYSVSPNNSWRSKNCSMTCLILNNFSHNVYFYELGWIITCDS